MLKVHVLGHKDGDHLGVVKVPWWYPIAEFICHRLYPCCGVMSELSRFEWLGDRIYTLSNWLMRGMMKFEHEVYTVPIKSGCEASSKLWPKDAICWEENCEYHGGE